MDRILNPRNLLKYTGPAIYYIIIVYGSAPGDPLNDDRFGMDQRRVEIVAHPRLPRDNMSISEIQEFMDLFVLYQWQDFKHTNNWRCEFCDKPTRVSKTRVNYWAHLSPPRGVAYLHQLCDNVKGNCIKRLREIELSVSLEHRLPVFPPIEEDKSGAVYPLASSCAQCNEDSTADSELLHCSGCKLTRYCSTTCQTKDWQRHKPFCKTPKQVKWVGS